MDVAGPAKNLGNNKNDRKETLGQGEASPGPRGAASQPQPEEANAQTHVNLVSPFAHPRSAKVARFDLRQFVTSHSLPIALSCLALGGAVAAAVILKRRRHDSWDARLARLRQSLVDAANGAG
jgi:hypothetical protein